MNWKQLGGRMYLSTDFLKHSHDFHLDLSFHEFWKEKHGAVYLFKDGMGLTSCNL